MASMPQPSAWSTATPSPMRRGDVGLPHLEPAGVVAHLVASPAPSRWRRGGRASPARSAGSAPGACRGTRCRVGPAGTCGRCRSARRTRARARRAAAGPTDWQASSTKSTPASRHSRPTSTAGFTRPPWVGTWTRQTMAVSSAASARSRASRSIWPWSSSSTSTSWQPVRRWSCSSAMALAPYSARLMSTRSCGSIGQRVHRHVPRSGGGVHRARSPPARRR